MKRYKRATRGGNPITVTVYSDEDIREKLNEYEAKYNMKTVDFVQKYYNYEFKDEDINLMDWVGYYYMGVDSGMFNGKEAE